MLAEELEALARAKNRACDMIVGYSHEAQAAGEPDHAVDRQSLDVQKLLEILICSPLPQAVEVVIAIPQISSPVTP